MVTMQERLDLCVKRFGKKEEEASKRTGKKTFLGYPIYFSEVKNKWKFQDSTLRKDPYLTHSRKQHARNL